MKKPGLFICLLVVLPSVLPAQIDTIFNLNRATSHFIKDDTIWLAARSGVVKRLCSTGTVLATYTHENAPIPYHSVSDVCVDNLHRMWLYIEEKGIAMLDGDQWTFWTPDQAFHVLVGGFGGKIIVDNDGIPWIGASYRTPMCYVNGTWQLPPDPTFESFDTREMKIGSDGKMWVVDGYGGIYRHNGTSWEAVVAHPTPVTDFALAPGGGFYTCGSANGISEVFYYPGVGVDSVLIGTLNGMAQHIAVAPSGRIYVAGQFAEGIAYFENSQWQYIEEKGELYPLSVSHLNLSVDSQGRLWDTRSFFGTKVYDGAQWQRIWTGPIGFEKGVAMEDGSIWFGYLNTLSKYNPATGQTEYVYLKTDTIFQSSMVGMERGPDGTFYAASQWGELAWYDGNGNFKKSVQPFGFGFAWDAFVRMAVDQSNNLFFQGWDVFSDVIRYNAKTGARSTLVKYHNTDPSIPFDETYSFQFDKSGRLWMYTDKGLVYWKNGSWKTFYEPSPVMDFPENITAGANGVWIYAGAGQQLQYFNGVDTASWFMPLDVANGEQIFKLYADGRNWLWCMTNQSRVLCFTGYGWEIYGYQTGTFPEFTMNSMFEDATGNMWFLNSDDIALRLNISTGRISGQLFDDLNLDCSVQPGEPGMGGFKVVFDDGQKRIETVADAQGEFSASIPPGNYTAYVIPLSSLGQSCQSGFAVTVVENANVALQIPVQTLLYTPLLSVRMGTSVIRPCRESTYFGNVCNDGNIAAESAEVTLEMPAGLSFVGASVPFSIGTTGLVTLQIGQVDFNTCRDFSFVAKAGCPGEVALGQSLCVTAHVFPDTIPTIGNSAWTGASIVLNGQCVGSKVVFTVKNEGLSATLGPLQYQVIKDAYLHESGAIGLSSNAETSFEYEADGSTWRFSIAQEPGHPLAPPPSVAVEGCVTGTQDRSSGFVAQADNATGSAFEYTDCHEVTGSFDPNDKQSQPTGWGSQHQILPGQGLHYTIRFQNTGTDTAFTVVIRDTLDKSLDWSSFRPELSSHAFHVDRDSIHRAIAFVFDNILLPDSNVNEAASHGFVRFFIRSRTDIPLKTAIHNRASIYFDFNTAVVTNTVLHTVDTGFIRVKPVPPPYNPDARIYFAPNPATQDTWLSVEYFDPEQTHLLKIYDAMGRLVRSIDMPESPWLLKKEGLATGVYQVGIWADGKRVAVGQVVFYE